MNIPIIKTQLTPPAVKDQYIRRAGLQKKLSTVPHHPITLIHSGAGYGKSTALSLFANTTSMPISWYSVSSNDDDLIPFLMKLVHSIRLIHPHFGEKIEDTLMTTGNYIHEQELWSLISSFVNEVLDIGDMLIVVLDDFHHVQQAPGVEKWVRHLLAHLPSNLHLILSTRMMPVWEELTRARAKGDLLVISQKDLIFTQEEMEHLMTDVYFLPINETERSAIIELTEGWAIAFTMLVQQLQSRDDLETIRSNRRDSLKDLFDYLALEVISKQSMITQNFLIQTSILEVMTVRGCDAILDISGSEAMLKRLADQHLFIQNVDETHYRYHALFKEFLENKFKEEQPGEFYYLNERAGEYFEKQGMVDAAIHHWLLTDNKHRVAALLVEHAEEMLHSGRLQKLKEVLMTLPDEVKHVHPLLWFYQGESFRYRSEYQQAEQCYQSAEDYGRKKDDNYLVSLALEGRARIYLDTIQPGKGERLLHHAIELREQGNGKPEDMARLYHLLAENLLNAGQAKKAESWFNRAKALNLPLQEDNLEARLMLRTGRLVQGKAILLKEKQKQQDQTAHLPQSHRETDVLLSIIESFMGNAEAGKISAQEGINVGMNHEAPFVEACGWIRLGHAVQLLNRYELHMAEKCYQTSLDMMEKLDVSRGKAEPYMGLCILYGKQQEYEKAMEVGQLGLNETERVKDLWLSSFIQLCIGIASVHCGRLDKAYKLVDAVERQFDQCGDDYGLMLCSYWKSFISFEKGNDEKFQIDIRHFLQRIQAGNYEFFLRQRTTHGPADLQNMIPMLLKAKRLQIHDHYVGKLVLELGFGNMEQHPGYTLDIRTLGSFEVWLGNHQIQAGDWQRGKAKELFELFVTKRNQLLTKEEILQYLWPDQEEESANRNFKVTLNALLKTLEPNRKARENSFFIKKSGSAYGLNSDAGYELDSAAFEEAMLAGMEEKKPAQARKLLADGLKLYQGDYLPERRLEDWCVNERERLQVIYLRGAERMAQLSVRLEDYDSVIYWAEAILKTEQTWEEAYRLLMYGYYQKNNRPQAIKWFDKCCRVLKDELGVEPMNPTMEMYHMIRGAENIQMYT